MKLKKILSAVTALAMGVTMMFATSLTASAIGYDGSYSYGTGIEELDDYEEIATLLSIAANDKGNRYNINVAFLELDAGDEHKFTIPSNLTIQGYFDLDNGAYLDLEEGAVLVNPEITFWSLSSLQNMQDFYCEGSTFFIYTSYISDDILNADLTLNNYLEIRSDNDNELKKGKTQTYNNGFNYTSTGTSKLTNSGTLIVKNGFTIKGNMENNGVLQIDDNATFNGTVTNNGTICSDYVFNNLDTLIADGKLINKGTVKNADGSNSITKTPITATTTIPTPTYTVTIPATVDFGEVSQALPKYENATNDKQGNPIVVSKNFTVTAECSNLFEKNLTVKIGNTGDSFLLESGTSTIPTKLYCGENSYTMGSTFATFEDSLNTGANNTQSGKISINRTKITENAAYTGTLTFNISVE